MATTLISTSNTTAALGAVLGIGNDTASLGTTGLTGVVVNIDLGLASNFVVNGSAHSTVTINQDLAAVTSLTLNTDGADFILQNPALSIGALSGTTVDINDGGTLQMGSNLISASILTSGHVSFGAGGGTDLITNTAGFIALDLLTSTAPIAGFTSSADLIVDEALEYSAITGYSVSSSAAGVQTVTVLTSDNSNLTFAVTGSDLNGGVGGSFALGTGPLHLTADSAGVALTLCFLAGTKIATPDGQADIETLQPGDLVLTADGRSVPVRWIGVNTVATRFADPLRNMPVRISAGALGENLPQRDLLISPDHALFLNGILVQAGALVDNAAIHRDPHMPELFRYYHVEVASHDLILAEGVPAETFVDNVSRMAFDNWEEFMTICGNEPPTGELAYPRAKSRRQLPEALLTQLTARAAALQSRTAA